MKRHGLITRLWHWLNVICLIILLMSGLNISNAHRFLYWGDYGYLPSQAWAQIPRFPGWMTIPDYYSLAAARDWHILAAWPFSIGLLVMWVAILVTRRLGRDLRTSGAEWKFAAIKRDIAAHLRFDFEREGRKYSFLQRVSYLIVLGIFLPLMVLTGLAISPGFEPAAPWMVDMFGGRQSARSLHFIFAGALTLFFLVHVVLVLLVKPVKHIGAMITGGNNE